MQCLDTLLFSLKREVKVMHGDNYSTENPQNDHKNRTGKYKQLVSLSLRREVVCLNHFNAYWLCFHDSACLA